jgi:ABC-type phosphate transport system substrate-binding protein
MQVIVNNKNKYTEHTISERDVPSIFHTRIRKWDNVTVDKINAVLDTFMLMWIV